MVSGASLGRVSMNDENVDMPRSVNPKCIPDSDNDTNQSEYISKFDKGSIINRALDNKH